MIKVGRYVFRIVTDGKLFKPQRARLSTSWWDRNENGYGKWEDLCMWPVPLDWAKKTIGELEERERDRDVIWTEVDA